MLWQVVLIWVKVLGEYVFKHIASRPIHPDILMPEFRVFIDELHHKHRAPGLVQHLYFDAAALQQFLFPFE